MKMIELDYFIKKIIDNRGKTPPIQEQGIPLIETASLIGDSKYIDYLKVTKYISKETYKNWFRAGHPSKDDLLISLVGTNMGNLCIYNEKDFGAIAQNLVALRLDETKCDSNFIYYFLSSRESQELLKGLNRGSAQPNLKVSDLKKFQIPNLNLETQQKISSILSSLDDKIELNNEMNKTLEEMAQTLFKQWFIDFEFPNENGEPYKSSGGKMVESELGEIPEGWRVINFDNIAEMNNGYSYKGKELAESHNAMITIKNFNRNGGFKEDGFKEIILSDKVKATHFVEKGDVIVAHTDLTQGAEIIGNSIYIQNFGKYNKIITSMDTVKVKSKNEKISNLIIHMFLNTRTFKDHALRYVNGTTVLHLSKKAIPEYKVAIPFDEEIFVQMNKILKPLYENLNSKFEEVQNLTKIRDVLLPKLMNGEVEI